MEEEVKNKINSIPIWYENTIVKFFGVITGFVTIVSIGYAASEYRNKLEMRMLKHELKLECNEKLQVERNKYEVEVQTVTNKRVESIEELVKALEHKIDKNEK